MCRNTEQKLVMDQMKRTKWNWSESEKNEDRITKQALQQTLQNHRQTGRPINAWKLDLIKDM